ncbi:MAG: hypothetical protein Q4D58_04405 [Synergistaceae bacterium]|nr:hypothetical protein [Synergistaceae bacterium]
MTRRAFITAELAVAFALSLAALPMLLTPFRSSAELYLLRGERLEAERKAETVAAILDEALLCCGIGVPFDAGDYKASFGSRTFNPFSWHGPLSVAEGKSGEENGTLRLAYGVQEGVRTDAACSSDSGELFISFTSTPNPDYLELGATYNKGNFVKNWILFENISPPRLPLLVTQLSGRSLKVRSTGRVPFAVPKGDRLTLFRAMECYAASGTFYTKDFRTAGEQPRESAVCDARFELDPGRKLLTIYLLVRGSGPPLSAGRIYGGEDWPRSYLEPWERTELSGNLYAFKLERNLPNLASGGSE